MSKIRILWNDFEKVIGPKGLVGDAAKQAIYNFRAYVDTYIEAMAEFMRSNAAVKAAQAAHDNALVRSLLEAESARVLTGARKAAEDAVNTAAKAAGQ